MRFSPTHSGRSAHEVLNVKPGNRYPSDHFGVMVDLTLQAPVPDSQPPGG